MIPIKDSLGISRRNEHPLVYPLSHCFHSLLTKIKMGLNDVRIVSLTRTAPCKDGGSRVVSNLNSIDENWQELQYQDPPLLTYENVLKGFTYL